MLDLRCFMAKLDKQRIAEDKKPAPPLLIPTLLEPILMFPVGAQHTRTAGQGYWCHPEAHLTLSAELKGWGQCVFVLWHLLV